MTRGGLRPYFSVYPDSSPNKFLTREYTVPNKGAYGANKGACSVACS